MRPWGLKMLLLCLEHPRRDQNPKFTPLSETTSILVCFIWESPGSNFFAAQEDSCVKQWMTTQGKSLSIIHRHKKRICWGKGLAQSYRGTKKTSWQREMTVFWREKNLILLDLLHLPYFFLHLLGASSQTVLTLPDYPGALLDTTNFLFSCTGHHFYFGQ